MVSTRRMESGGSTVETLDRLSRAESETRKTSNSCSSNNEEVAQEEESSESQCTTTKQHKRPENRVRELRNRFVCSNISYTSKRIRRQEERSCRTLNARRTVYSRHEMQDESDEYLIQAEDSDDIFTPSLMNRKSKKSSGRYHRSLRPLKNKSYADPHSSMHSNSSGEEKRETDLRRSTRQRTLKYGTLNTSWITDAQMVKGYPNFEMDFLTDQDSRHSQENGHHAKLYGLRSSSTRKSENDIRNKSDHRNGEVSGRREIKKKYIYDYETNEMRSRRITLKDTQAQNDSKDVKSNVEEDINRSKSRSRAQTKEHVEHNENSNSNSTTDNTKESIVNGDKIVNEAISSKIKDDENNEIRTANVTVESQIKEEDADSESEQENRTLRKRRRSNLNYMNDPRYSPRRTRNRKIIDSDKSSDSFDEDIRSQRYKYQLRQRKPKKPEQMTMEPPVRSSVRIHSYCARRRFEHRRNSSSNDSEDERVRSRKSNKTKQHRHPVSNNYASSSDQTKSGAAAPIAPETLDAKVRFDSVGGLDHHVRCLREMVVLPMMYPEVFKQFQITPPRGVLFHGPPGTGKTLLARALANECSFGSQKVTFFMRKGADMLCKWVGESEKTLRLLFEQASEMKPSIIFFDELDGLAPVRSTRQDQIHSSIVSTLLALMDGLNNRGEVIVIGATNRIDAIDPALRRPGRFDRELYFPLPSRREREAILKVHVSQWNIRPNDAIISHLAETSSGYCGSDLRALCSEAVIQGLRRTYPQVYTTDYKLQLDPTQVKVEKIDFLRARSLLIPAAHRVTQGIGRKLPRILEPLLRRPLNNIIALFKESFPHGIDPSLSSVKVSSNLQIAQLLISGDSSAQGQSTYLAPALLYHMEHVNTYTLDLTTLFKESNAEEACVEIFREARRNVPSVIYVPCIDQLWTLVQDTVQAIFLNQLASLDPSLPILLLATANVEYKELPENLSSIFSPYRKEVLNLPPPVTIQREVFFKSLIITASKKPPRKPKRRPETPPPLPKAPTPPPEPISQAELQKIHEKEESTLRELRIFLRDMCKKIARNKRFYMFTKPVDLEEVPDYLSIIKQPMDLETMMTKVDLHRYSSAQEFLSDIDLICMNALEYNPAKTSADKQIRHCACSLKDYAYALIKAEMDSDFEDQCRLISKKRRERKMSESEFLPPFIHTQPLENEDETKDTDEINLDNTIAECPALKSVNTSSNSNTTTHRKRKIPSWARGYLGTRKKKRNNRNVFPEPASDEVYKNEAKSSSGDESKENKPEESESQLDTMLEVGQSVDLNTPLTVNCDTESLAKSNKISPLDSNASKKSKLSDNLSPAIWPSYADLIEDTPHVEDSDYEDDETKLSGKLVNVDENELLKALAHAVVVTKGLPVHSLMDLYEQLNRVLQKYIRTHERESLPREYIQEINRFDEIHKNCQSTTRCQTPAS